MALLALAGCGAAPPPAAAPAAKPLPPADELNRLVERYWDQHIATEDAVAPQTLADSLSIERRYLAEVLAVPRDRLDAQSKLSYDIFKRRREIMIEGFTFPSELLPVNPFGGRSQRLELTATALAQHPPASAAGYSGWLAQIDDYLRWSRQAIANMRDGMRRGYTTPRSVIARMLPILERLGADVSANAFYAPLRSMPEMSNAAERARLTKDMTSAVSARLLPAIRALHDFLQNEYLPRARSSLALSELPLGGRWYAYRIKRATGSALSPDEINRIGVAEVERLGAAPTREAPPAAATGLVNGYRELEPQIRAALPAAFAEFPKQSMDIRGVQWPGRPATALYYERGTPGAPAILYVNTSGSRPEISIADFLEQGVPGRHFQISLQQELSGLPSFRRFGKEPVFTRGWGLYAVTLGEELGLYADDSSRSDAVLAQLRCAVALVVDTGLHAKGWTRDQAFDYLRAHSGVGDLDAQALIDFYAAQPADALACMMGELEFRALRTRAQQSLGSRFDLRVFHTEILKDGAMPPDLLETKMKAWMDASK
ncbi:MAG TPA: DUF885 family protein [Steroidobacteraceae bacterium]|jgi:uncharacterized protein (DUF885 family)|nr:DUF885 family protein [Steroidobacteraceae bacterium]